MTRPLRALAEISDRYDALFCDLWGCVHNGLAPWPAAVAALRAFRAGGGAVVLVTNAPRPRAEIEGQITRMGLPRDCWDAIATSGDSARAAMFQGAVGRRVWHVGEAHDDAFFAPLRLLPDAPAIARVPLDQAEGIVCTGPFDPHAAPETLRGPFLSAIARGLKLLCANPDIVVDRGESREYCAGALAALYTAMGGESLYFGKPHPPIYDLARRRLAALGRDVEDARILALGDGLATDIAGGMGENLDTLFLTGGLAAAETATPPGGDPDPARLAALLAKAAAAPTYTMGFLR
ncbi:MAG: TIGR01459 family HAD-type hydrolase [Rhodobacteraceae bacterium]|nr:TIGR01459 family HAD-type hydrolase [Paracoccaceae bacterium]